MPPIQVRPMARGHGDSNYRLSLGMAIMPDVSDDAGWNTVVQRGIPHYEEWSSNVPQSYTRPFALSYKHTEHDFGCLSPEQAAELRANLRKLVGPGRERAILWVDSIYMMREGLGFDAYSARWVKYGLIAYTQLPVIRLQAEWDRRHKASGKLSAWLWLERELGKHNQGVFTTDGQERAGGDALSVEQALRRWVRVEKGYGFRPDDEASVRTTIAGTAPTSPVLFRCPGRCACIRYMLGRRDTPCGGASAECGVLAKSTNGSFYKEDMLILSTVGRIADSVLKVTRPANGAVGNLQRLNLSRTELEQYTKVLNSRQLAFRNVRWLQLEDFLHE